HQAEVFAGLRQTLEDAGARMGDDREPHYTPESLASIEGGARRRSVEARTLRLLRRHWPAVQAIAAALEAHGKLSHRELTRICKAHGVRRASV
ncbi:MAG TPA: hypothetical protein VL334_19720, partial [Anaerolineae bacterium]|nr:hypothetical protein [Anaerolineae bacterium]